MLSRCLLFRMLVLFVGLIPLYASVIYSSSVNHLHHNSYTEVPKAINKPGIGLGIQKDNRDGWDLYIVVENFKIGPPTKTWSRQKRMVQGHAHLYINGKKVSRVYSPWFHIKSKYLTNDTNIIRVVLNNHNHIPWSLDSEVIQAKLQVSINDYEMKVMHHSSSPLVGKRRVN